MSDKIDLKITGFNLLSFCILTMHLPSVKYLITQGYEICPVDASGSTPLLDF